VTYGVLLYLMLAMPASPLHNVDDAIRAPPMHMRRTALLPSPPIPGQILLAARWITVISWGLTTAGVWQRWTSILTATGFFVLDWASRDAVGTSNYWLLPLAAVFCLAMCSWGGKPQGVLQGVLGPRFGRRLLLLAAVGMLFSSGVCKLRFGGLRWAYGPTMQQYLRWERHLALFPGLNKALSSSEAACTAVSVATLALELGAPLALISPGFRNLVVRQVHLSQYYGSTSGFPVSPVQRGGVYELYLLFYPHCSSSWPSLSTLVSGC